MLRCCDGDEPVPATRARAANAAETLSQLAEQHGTLVVIGHGWFNRFVARELAPARLARAPLATRGLLVHRHLSTSSASLVNRPSSLGRFPAATRVRTSKRPS